MNQRANRALLTVIGLLPPCRSKSRFLGFLGHEIEVDVRIGVNLFRGVDQLRLASGTRIGSFNVFRQLKEVDLARSSRIGSWNWFSASPDFAHLKQDMFAVLRLKSHAAITSRHYVDCSGGVAIGSFSILAGQRSVVLSHGIDFESNEQRIRPVLIGDYCFVSTGCTLVSGTRISDQTVVAAGAVVSGQVGKNKIPSLWGGVPARFIKELSGDYFTRTRGYVGVRSDSGPVAISESSK